MAQKRPSYCVRHQERPTETRCAGCLKPICQDCTLLTEVGTFCGSDCYEKRIAYNDRADSMKSQPVDSMGWRLLRGLVPWVVPALLLCALVFFWPKLPQQWRAPFEKVFTSHKK